ncbi:MAG: hypothetical protein VXX42_12610 [SAR324 cluster bacterium]|nr:hypothetical protein [SAR324 cluster bacterium]
MTANPVPGSGSILCFAGGATLVFQGHPGLRKSRRETPFARRLPGVKFRAGISVSRHACGKDLQ